MRLTITARDGDDDDELNGDLSNDLRTWLGRQRELRGLVGRETGARPTPATMGASTEVITALLVPGGVATVLASAVVAWVRNRTGKQTVTLTRADGAQITVTSDKVRILTASQVGELVQQLAASLEPWPPDEAKAASAAPKG